MSEYLLRRLAISSTNMPKWKEFEYAVAYLTNSDPWSDVSPEFKDARDLPTRDTGIDLANNTTAVQCKYYSQHSTVSWDSVAKFLASAKLGPTPFHTAILAVVEGTSVSTVRRNCYDLKYCIQKDLDEVIEKAKSLPPVEGEILKRVPLRPYQDKALAAMLGIPYTDPSSSSGASSSSTGPIDTPVNTKPCSFVILDEDEDPINISLPCGTGKSQLVAEYLLREKPDKAVVFVPSRLLLEQMSELLTVYELKHQKVGTNYNDKIDMNTNLFVCVYNSAPLLQEIEFDVLIVDEAHHIYVPAVYKDAQQGMEDGRAERKSLKQTINGIVTRRRIHLSATLNDPTYTYPLEKAIEEGYLTDYDISIPLYDAPISDTEVKALLDNHPEYRSVLLYSNSVVRAKKVQLVIGDSCGFMDADTSMQERKLLLRKFSEGSLRALSTVNVLGEGINIPIADTAIFVEKRFAKINVVQCVGRVLRKHSTKKMAHIVLPTAGNEEEELVRIMSALRWMDMRVGTAITKHGSRIWIGRENGVIASGKLVAETLFDRFGTCLKSAWDFKYELLVEFVEKNGRLPKYDEDYTGVHLGRWCQTQRQAYTGHGHNKITATQIERLEQVQGWWWATNQKDKWMEKYELLRKYVLQYNRLPIQKDIYEGINIGSFINRQRSVMKGHVTGIMTPARKHLLESLPCWKW